MNIKNIIVSLFTGFKKGFLIPTLPENILKIQSYPLIRILRFLGGVSMLFVLSRAHTNFPIYFLYIAIFIMFLFFIYHDSNSLFDLQFCVYFVCIFTRYTILVIYLIDILF